MLRETVEALEALRANEERTDANSIGEMIGGDPLMTLKVLAYVSAHRGRSVVTGAETVIAALVMMGIPPFFRAFAAPTAVEDRLAQRARGAGRLQRVLRRAHRGARFALAFAVHRTDPHAATIHAAALLHEFAELLLWCHAPGLALRVQALQDADPALRSSVAQQRVLQHRSRRAAAGPGRGLAAAVPARRVEPGAAAPARPARARSPSAARLARHTADGWDNAAVPDDISEIAAFLNLSPAAALKLVMEIDAE